MKETQEVYILRLKELIPQIRLDGVLKEINPDHRQDFLKKLLKLNHKMCREMLGGHKVVHQVND